MSTVEEYHKSARDCLRWAAKARTEGSWPGAAIKPTPTYSTERGRPASLPHKRPAGHSHNTLSRYAQVAKNPAIAARTGTRRWSIRAGRRSSPPRWTISAL
jgi:hypothetical protein